MDKLEEICAKKREHVARAKAETPLAALERRIKDRHQTRGFANALRAKIAQGTFGLITEIKKASPSAGLIRPDFDPPSLANAYEEGGAACLSVLTDIPYFQGENAFVDQARNACTLPVLRKDFMIDVWQVYEARSIGADCILIIMAALNDKTARDLHDAAVALNLDILIETHTEDEVKRALDLPSGMIGINNRNLKTLQTDLAMTEKLAPLVPQDRLLIGESGIKTREDLMRLHACGVSCFLIGESLMKQADVAAATKALLQD